MRNKQNTFQLVLIENNERVHLIENIIIYNFIIILYT